MSLEERLTEIEKGLEENSKMLSILLSAIVVSQKDAAKIASVSPLTIINKVRRGEVEDLSADGSRLNFLRLEAMPKLKERSKKR